MTSRPLLYERRDHAAWITFNRPHAMNAFNSELYAAILQALDDAAVDPEVRVAVLIGEGGRAFSAGADLKELADFDARGIDADAEPGKGMGGTQVFEKLATFVKPLVAAVDGHCLAGGMEVASLCDIRVATEHSGFGLPEARLSLMPGPGLVELGRLMPLGEALWVQLTGRPMSARRAFDIGFVQALLPDRAALVAEAEQIAADIALGAPLAVEAYKTVAKGGRDLPLHEASRLRDRLWDQIQSTEDRLEGPRAFTEKRLPRWKRS
jgi:enoyl-CoA hydratase/carnithine racemase